MRVLIVEDERRLADVIARGLRGEGFSVDVAGTGLEGLRRLTEFSYDAVLLDIMLPQISGYEVLRRARAASIWTPVLMLTAKDGEYDIADALDLGADDYLAKPFSFVVLVARLRALMRRGMRPRPAILRAGPLLLDPASHRFERNGKHIELTPREFSLMEYFLRHPGEVLSKQRILAHVWDEPFEGDPNVVEVYVGYLRRKLGDQSGTLLQTVRGVGYRLAHG